MKKNILKSWIFILFFPMLSLGKDYNASLFGIKSEGITMNTQSIQKAIDFINEKGGGKLVFSVGRYLTGSIELKSNVIIELKEGAVLVAASNIHEYLEVEKSRALISADGQENIGIIGKGVLEGKGVEVLASLSAQSQKGYVKESILQASPTLISFKNCKGITTEGIYIQNACGNVISLSNCQRIQVQQITIKSTSVKGSNGLVIKNCEDVRLKNSFIETSGSEILGEPKTQTLLKENVKNAAGKIL
jgi:polygalacturonase